MEKYLDTKRLNKQILGFIFCAIFLTAFASGDLDSILVESSLKPIKQLPVLKVNANSINSPKTSNYILNKPNESPVLKSQSVNMLQSPSTLNRTLVNTSQFNNLDAIDKDSNDLNQLNRKLQVEKVEAEIRKIKKGGVDGVTNNQNSTANENAQTTVTGVAINAQGRKIAWLQFADGGTLTVNVGSSVGKYKVIDISMTGVTIGEEVGRHKRMKTLFLKRVYANNNSSSKHGNFINKGSSYFTPSPIITGANSKSDYVPPIVPLN